jgi:hypothetical protein
MNEEEKTRKGNDSENNPMSTMPISELCQQVWTLILLVPSSLLFYDCVKQSTTGSDE